MTSSYFQSRGIAKDAPIEGTEEENYGVEAPNQTEAVNNEIGRLDADRDRLMDLYVRQYNYMHQQNMNVPKQLLNMTKSGIKIAQEYRDYKKLIEPMERFHRDASKAKYGADNAVFVTEGKVVDTPYKEVMADENDIKKQNTVEGKEIDAQSQANTISSDPSTPLGAKIELRNGVNNSVQRRSIQYEGIYEAKQNWPLFHAKANDTMKVPVPMPDGSTKLMSFNDAELPEHARYILNAQLYHYLYSNKDLTMGRPGRFKRDFILPLMTKADTIMADKISKMSNAAEEVSAKLRAKDLQYQIEANPSYGIDHVNLYKGQLGSVKAAKLDLANNVARLVKTGQIEPSVVHKLLDHEFLALDSTPEKPHMVSMRKYWKEETGIILKALREAQTEQWDETNNQKKHEQREEAIGIRAGWDNSKTPVSAEQKFQQIQQYKLKHNIINDEDLPEELKGYGSREEILDDSVDRDLTRRLNRGEILTVRDLEGISDPDLKQEWIKKLPESGLKDEEIDDFITPAVNQKTQETDNNTAKTLKWKAYQDNARNWYRKIYAQAKANGATHQEAQRAARDYVIGENGLDLGKSGDTPWATWGGTLQPVSAITNLGVVKSQLSKDKSLLYSDKPWVGEEDAIKQAIAYQKDKRTNIPLYYRQFPGIKLSPINLMRQRLKSLGLLKDGDLIPEDKLPPHLQELLRKPSPGKTNRVLIEAEEEGIKLIDPKRFDNRGRNAISAVRDNAQVAQRYSTIDDSYRKLVNIPPELNDEFVAQVGDLPPYMQLNNLAPEVAKAFIGDILLT